MPSPDVHSNAVTGAGAAPSAPTPPPLGTIIDDGTNAGPLQLVHVRKYISVIDTFLVINLIHSSQLVSEVTV